MKIVRETVPTCTIQEFADRHGLTMSIRERPGPLAHLGRLIAAFEKTDVLSGGMLVGAYGNGNTEEEAIADYARRISEQIIAVDALTPNRREIVVPRLQP